MSNVKGGYPNPPRLKHKGFIFFAYRIMSDVTVSNVDTKGYTNDFNIEIN
jgi:hypothetical protein